jgi:predicted nucleic acid-binding protein
MRALFDINVVLDVIFERDPHVEKAAAAVDDVVIRDALTLPCPDFEDAVCAAAARRAKCDMLITRDLKGYRGAQMQVLAPLEALATRTALSGVARISKAGEALWHVEKTWNDLLKRIDDHAVHLVRDDIEDDDEGFVEWRLNLDNGSKLPS